MPGTQHRHEAPHRAFRVNAAERPGWQAARAVVDRGAYLVHAGVLMYTTRSRSASAPQSRRVLAGSTAGGGWIVMQAARRAVSALVEISIVGTARRSRQRRCAPRRGQPIARGVACDNAQPDIAAADDQQARPAQFVPLTKCARRRRGPTDFHRAIL
jgi:hypothetical protein